MICRSRHICLCVTSRTSGKLAGSYSYRAKACNAAGCGPLSGSVSVQEIDPPASAPSLIAPPVNTTGNFTVSWTAVSGATTYQLDEMPAGGSWALVYNGASISSALSGRSTSVDQSYRVRGCNAAGCGPHSATVTVQRIIYSAQYIGQSAPASIAPGEVIAVSVTMKNTGNTTWTAAEAFRLGSQSAADNLRWGLNRAFLPVSVAPAQTVTFNFNITGPTDGVEGMRAFQWQMVRDGVGWFGPMTPDTWIWLDAPPAEPCAGCYEN